jgi:Tfp pilus assembly protein FimT
MINKEFGSQSGKSLVEIFIVLTIIAVLVSFAVARFGNSRTFFQRQNIAREFKVNLERARFDSIKRRAEGAGNLSRVSITSATSFTVTTDLNQNGTLETAETRQIDFSNRDGIKFVGASSYPVTMSFDRHGHVTTVNSLNTPVTPSFTICDADCTADTAGETNSNIITISQTGTVSMTEGGYTQPTFQSPNVSTVSSSANINNGVLVNTNTANVVN